MSNFGKVKQAYHGTNPLDFKIQQSQYRGLNIDISEARFRAIDTSFSIAHATIFAQLVDLKDNNVLGKELTYSEIESNVISAIDLAHRDGSLKNEVKKDFKKYIIQDETIAHVLERLKRYGKKLWLITNSDYNYTKALLDYALKPYLKDHDRWEDVFEISITLASKPRFFTDKLRFLEVNPKNEMLMNVETPIEKGKIYQGGSVEKLEKDLGVSGEDILYLGDHIYGDIVKLKKTCAWRTALVVEELVTEVEGLKKAQKFNEKIANQMSLKIDIEKKLDKFHNDYFDKHHKRPPRKESLKYLDKIRKIDDQISTFITKYENCFNPHWGEVMRAGIEPSFIAEQIQRYACIYMSKVSDLADYGPRTYFRPRKILMPHELRVLKSK